MVVDEKMLTFTFEQCKRFIDTALLMSELSDEDRHEFWLKLCSLSMDEVERYEDFEEWK